MMDHDQIMMDHQRLLGGIDSKLSALGALVETLVTDMGTVKIKVGAYESFSTSSMRDRMDIHVRLSDVEKWRASMETLWKEAVRTEERLTGLEAAHQQAMRELELRIEKHESEARGGSKLWLQIVTILGLIATAIGSWSAYHQLVSGAAK